MTAGRCHWLSEVCDDTCHLPYYRGQERCWRSEWECRYHCLDAECECSNCYQAIISPGYGKKPRFRIRYQCQTTAFPWNSQGVARWCYPNAHLDYEPCLCVWFLACSPGVGTCTLDY